MATITTMINDSRAGVAAEPLLRFLIRIALALLTTLAKKRSIGPLGRLQNQNSTSYTTRHEYQEGLYWLRELCGGRNSLSRDRYRRKQQLSARDFGAVEWIRTTTVLLPPAPQAGASANSATTAFLRGRNEV